MKNWFIYWFLRIAPAFAGWVAGAAAGGFWGLGFTPYADVLMTSVILSMLCMLIVALTARSKLWSGAVFFLVACAGFMTMTVHLHGLPTMPTILDITLYEYAAAGFAIGTALDCCAVSLAQSYWPGLNGLKN